jgi:hypothetical protein
MIFLDLNSVFLHTRLLEFAIAEHWSLLVTQIDRRRSPNYGIRLLKFGNTGWIPVTSPESSNLC